MKIQRFPLQRGFRDGGLTSTWSESQDQSGKEWFTSKGWGIIMLTLQVILMKFFFCWNFCDPLPYILKSPLCLPFPHVFSLNFRLFKSKKRWMSLRHCSNLQLDSRLTDLNLWSSWIFAWSFLNNRYPSAPVILITTLPISLEPLDTQCCALTYPNISPWSWVFPT